MKKRQKEVSTTLLRIIAVIVFGLLLILLFKFWIPTVEMEGQRMLAACISVVASIFVTVIVLIIVCKIMRWKI